MSYLTRYSIILLLVTAGCATLFLGRIEFAGIPFGFAAMLRPKDYNRSISNRQILQYLAAGILVFGLIIAVSSTFAGPYIANGADMLATPIVAVFIWLILVAVTVRRFLEERPRVSQ